MHAIVNWQKGMSFQAINRGLESFFDTTQENGGSNSAPSPKEAVLNAMCACSGIDVVSIAEKMRVNLTALSMEAKSDKSSTIPSYFSKVHITYRLQGDDQPEKFITNNLIDYKLEMLVLVGKMYQYCLILQQDILKVVQQCKR
jgi:putative redox protein